MARKTSLPGMLDAVEREAVEFLREHEPPEGYQLCFSGGKDSIVMRNLADIASVKYRALFNCTTIDPPSYTNSSDFTIRIQSGTSRSATSSSALRSRGLHGARCAGAARNSRRAGTSPASRPS